MAIDSSLRVLTPITVPLTAKRDKPGSPEQRRRLALRAVVHSDSRRQRQRSASGKIAPPWLYSLTPAARVTSAHDN
jgi:hypothetical protein